MLRSRQLTLPATFSSAEYLELLEKGELEPRRAFLRSFRRRLPPIAKSLAMAHKELDKLNPYTASDERTATIHMFLHVALNSLFTSSALLVEGYPVVSGHLMRQYGEAVAMALLILDDNPAVWLEYDRLGTRYPVHESIHRPLKKETARRLKRLVGFDVSGWAGFVAITKFYDKLSHPSALSLAFHMILRHPGTVVIGAAFDPIKRRELGIELTRRSSATRQLVKFIRATRKVLKERSRKRSA